MSYASITDLTNMGLPAQALGQLSTAQQQAALDSATETIDSYLRGRYALPLLAWGIEVNQWCAIIAAYNLMTTRGSYSAGSDRVLKDRFDRAMLELGEVQRQARHPNVTPQLSQTPTYNAPQVWTSSQTSTMSAASAGVQNNTSRRGW